MSTKSQVLRVSFRTPGRVDVEPPSVADSLREFAMSSPRAWQAGVVAVEDDEVVEVFFFRVVWAVWRVVDFFFFELSVAALVTRRVCLQLTSRLMLFLFDWSLILDVKHLTRFFNLPSSRRYCPDFFSSPFLLGTWSVRSDAVAFYETYWNNW
jgi:hypothetical protein